MSSLKIEVNVNESYIRVSPRNARGLRRDRCSGDIFRNLLHPRTRVVATLDASPDWEIPARVITTIPAADRQRADGS